MSKLLCNVLKISGGGKCPKCPPPLVAHLTHSYQREDVSSKLVNCTGEWWMLENETVLPLQQNKAIK